MKKSDCNQWQYLFLNILMVLEYKNIRVAVAFQHAEDKNQFFFIRLFKYYSNMTYILSFHYFSSKTIHLTQHRCAPLPLLYSLTK